MSIAVPMTVGRPDRKLASRMADQFIVDLAHNDWPIGTVVGSEADLLERYEISRAVFREAIRLLEHLGLATTRRGPGGGVIVTEPSARAVTQAFMVYLTYAGTSFGDLIEARRRIEGSIARLAAERADEEQIEILRRRVAADHDRQVLDAGAHHVLHTLIARASRNPTAELFIDVLGRLTARWSYPSRPEREQKAALAASARAHERLIDAIASGDAAAAERFMVTHLAALGDWLGRHRLVPTSIDWALDEAAEEKLGSRVARRIIVDIVDRDWPIGAVIGSENELISRLDVSRAALREGVRLLEYHEVATMRPGPGGGLVVTSPSVEPIVRSASLYLEHRGVTTSDLIALRRDIESEAVAVVAERATTADLVRLRALLDVHTDLGVETIDDDLHVNIAEMSGNPATSLFVRVLVELTRKNMKVPGPRSVRRSELADETDRAHRAIVEAIVSRDPALARRRLTKHLGALEPLLR